jgi:hypothetical protein
VGGDYVVETGTTCGPAHRSAQVQWQTYDERSPAERGGSGFAGAVHILARGPDGLHGRFEMTDSSEAHVTGSFDAMFCARLPH